MVGGGGGGQATFKVKLYIASLDASRGLPDQMLYNLLLYGESYSVAIYHIRSGIIAFCIYGT